MTIAKHITGATALGLAIPVGAGLSAPSARAAYIVMLEQVGSNVVASGSGTINTIDLSFEVAASDKTLSCSRTPQS